VWQLCRTIPRTLARLHLTDSPRAVDQALALRRWALDLLAGAHDPPPPAAGHEGWAAFLRSERCALALSARVGAARLRDDPAFAALRASVPAEAKRVLAARAQLATVGAAAARSGWKVAVLKGAAPLALGHDAPDLLDVDLWARPEDARAVAELLDSIGFAPAGRVAANRLAVRAAPGAMQVEIHTAVPWLEEGGAEWERLRPAGRLWRLAPADHAWHLLIHATEQHPERRGRIRELLLLNAALRDCSGAELAALRERAAARPLGGVLLAQMELAGALYASGEAPRDPFPLTAASGYILGMLHVGFPEWLSWMAWRATAAVVARREGGYSDVGGGTLHLPSHNPVLAWLRRVAPPAEQAARRLVRRGPEWGMAPLGLAVAAAAARAVRRRASLEGHPEGGQH
jgi:hypothetical protein